jgi:hypothetical protein
MAQVKTTALVDAEITKLRAGVRADMLAALIAVDAQLTRLWEAIEQLRAANEAAAKQAHQEPAQAVAGVVPEEAER